MFDPSQGAAGNVDLNRRAVLHSFLHTANGRLTWQATPKNKFTFYGAHYPRDQDGAYMSGVRSYEAAIHQEVVFGRAFQGVWKSPLTSRLLLEASYATFQANPGPEILANYTVTSAQVQGLGRALTTGTVTVPLVRPGTMFGDRIYQLDLRMSKVVQLQRGVRLRANLDLANALNSSAVLLQNNAYGTNWLRPSYILPGRLIRPSVQIDF